MNRITGEKKVIINGQGHVMRFTWRALAAIEAEFGDNPNLFNAEVLAKVASAGLAEKHPDMTPERIMDLSPPLMPFCADVKEAIQWAYFGTEAIPKADAPAEVKKNRLAGMLWRVINRLLRRG
jgi:hypothetical protein